MQLIEIYDNEDFRKNIYGALYFRPERVIFIHHHDVPNDHLQGHRNVLEKRLPSTEILFIPVDLSSFKQLGDAVDLIAEKKGMDITLDLYGGEEIANLYIKEYCEKRNFDIINIDPVKKTLMEWEEGQFRLRRISLPEITFREIVQLHGGDFSGTMHSPPPKERFEDIIRMSEYIFCHTSEWKKTSSYIQQANSENYFLDQLTFSAPLKYRSNKRMQHCDVPLLKKLQDNHFIYDLRIETESNKERISFWITDEYSREMLITTGSWLEAFLYSIAKRSAIFSEVHQGLKIDWDGKETMYNVINEIDLVLMKNEVPIFVSCKMRDVTTPAVNELEVYTEEFAGKYAQKVIATTDRMTENCSMYHRCRELGIKIIDITMLNEKRVLEFYNDL